MSTHAAKSTHPAKFAIDIAIPALPTDVTQPTGIASKPETPARRKSSVERYFRNARDRALREATVRNPQPDAVPAAEAQVDGVGASSSAGKADATKRALQVAENEGWKYRDCADRRSGNV